MNSNYYVYALIDPRNGKPFYIGKGINLRVYSHEKEADKNDSNEKEKLRIIHEIKNEGLDVIKDIVANNCTEEEAFNIEDIFITFYRKRGPLSNIQSGHKSKFSITSEQWNDLKQNIKVEFNDKDKLILLKPSRSFDYLNDEKERYEKFRGDWSASYNKAKQADYVCIVVNNIIKYMYKPTKWEYGIPHYTPSGRRGKTIRFSGERVIDHPYLNKSIKDVKKRVINKQNQIEERQIFGSGQVVGYINL